MRTICYLALILFTINTGWAQDKKGYGLRYADPQTLAKQNFVIPPRVPQGPVVIKKVDLSEYFPPVLSQGSIGSCASWASAYAMRSYLEKRQQGYSYLSADGSLDAGKVFSPLFIFNQVRESGHRCDSVGSYIGNNLERMKQVGVCKLGTFNPSPYKYPCCEAKPMSDPRAVSEATQFKIKDYGWIINDSTYYNRGYKLSAIKNFLLKDYPVILGIDFDSTFYDTGGQWTDSVYIWRQPRNEIMGSHAVVCIGFNDSLRAIKIFNSWGTGWGNKGTGYISYDLIDSYVYEAYVVNP